MKGQIPQKILLIAVLFMLTFSTVSETFAVTTLNISPSNGNVGTTITATGTGFTSSSNNIITSLHDYENTGTTNENGALIAQEFNGLTPGGSITSIGLKIATNGISNFTSLHDYENTGTTNQNGALFAQEFNNLPSGGNITSIGLKIATNGGVFVRVKIYSDSSGEPGTLLGESGQDSITSTGIQNFTVSATIPSSGIIWAAFETTALPNLYYYSATAGSSFYVLHTFGDGPSTFGSPSLDNNFRPYMLANYETFPSDMRVKIYSDNSGAPGNLIGESYHPATSLTGIQNFTVSATIPSSGIIWAAFETDTTGTTFYYSSAGSSYYIPHTFGPGPSTFGSPSIQEHFIPYMLVNYENLFNVAFKWDNSTLTTSPSTVSTNSTGGFSGVTFTVPNTSSGTHTVTASDTSGKSTTANFNVTSSISLNVTSGLVGTHVNVSGNGFASTSALSLLFDTSHLAMTPSSPSTNSFGSFTSLAFTVPSNATAGSHTVKIIDASNNQATANFNVNNLNIQVGNVTSGQFTQTYKTSGGT